ncbi:MAG: hypothetical protein AB7Q17_13685 [Phycisphaerae bacterium]
MVRSKLSAWLLALRLCAPALLTLPLLQSCSVYVPGVTDIFIDIDRDDEDCFLGIFCDDDDDDDDCFIFCDD